MITASTRRWVESACGSRVSRTRRLAGATTADMLQVEDQQGRLWCLRRYFPSFLAQEPKAPAREVAALHALMATQLPVPRIIAADLDGSAIGDGIPTILMTWLEGQTESSPDLYQLAYMAVQIHLANPASFDSDYFPWYRDTMVRPPIHTTQPHLWELAIGLWHDGMPTFIPRLVHRDFHPGNVIWKGRNIVGVIDWANACWGPADCDLAHCRTNLIDQQGPMWADRFAVIYQQMSGSVTHPYWEIAAVLEHDYGFWTPERIKVHEPRLARSVSQLI